MLTIGVNLRTGFEPDRPLYDQIEQSAELARYVAGLGTYHMLRVPHRWLASPLVDGTTTNLWLLPTSGGAMKRVTDFGDRSVEIARSVSWSADGRHLYAAIAELEAGIVLFDGLLQ